jgi:cyanate permease
LELLLGLYFASIAVTVNQFKVPPAIPLLVQELGMSYSQAGMLMSLFALSGFLLGIPSGWLVRVLGLRWSGFLAVAATAAGSLLGGLSGGPYFLMVCRLVEGFGMGTMTIVGPLAVTSGFSPSSRGLAMGVLSTWVPAGGIIGLLLAPVGVGLGGWRFLWFAGAGLAAAASVVYLRATEQLPGFPKEGRGEAVRLLLTRGPWLLALLFCVYTTVRIGYNSWIPTYIYQAGGSLALASFMATLNLIPTIPSNLMAGWLVQRLGSERAVYTLGFGLATPFWLLTFLWPVHLAPVALLILGGLAGMVPTSIFLAAPRLAGRPADASLAGSVVTMGQNLGMVLGPWLIGVGIEATGSWPAIGAGLSALSLVGIAAGWAAGQSRS